MVRGTRTIAGIFQAGVHLPWFVGHEPWLKRPYALVNTPFCRGSCPTNRNRLCRGSRAFQAPHAPLPRRGSCLTHHCHAVVRVSRTTATPWFVSHAPL
jgi:hypothetical protein